MILTITVTTNASNKGKIPILVNLARRKGRLELLAPASSRVVRKAIKVITAATLMAALIPEAVMVVIAVTVVIITLTFRHNNIIFLFTWESRLNK